MSGVAAHHFEVAANCEPTHLKTRSIGRCLCVWDEGFEYKDLHTHNEMQMYFQFIYIRTYIYIYSIRNIPYEMSGVRIHVKACKFTCENLLFYIDRGCEQPFSIIGLKHSKKNIYIMCFLCLKNLQTCGQYALVKDWLEYIDFDICIVCQRLFLALQETWLVWPWSIFWTNSIEILTKDRHLKLQL